MESESLDINIMDRAGNSEFAAGREVLVYLRRGLWKTWPRELGHDSRGSTTLVDCDGSHGKIWLESKSKIAGDLRAGLVTLAMGTNLPTSIC